MMMVEGGVQGAGSSQCVIERDYDGASGLAEGEGGYKILI
jgi:hypothetical protein